MELALRRKRCGLTLEHDPLLLGFGNFSGAMSNNRVLKFGQRQMVVLMQHPYKFDQAISHKDL